MFNITFLFFLFYQYKMSQRFTLNKDGLTYNFISFVLDPQISSLFIATVFQTLNTLALILTVFEGSAVFNRLQREKLRLGERMQLSQGYSLNMKQNMDLNPGFFLGPKPVYACIFLPFTHALFPLHMHCVSHQLDSHIIYPPLGLIINFHIYLT